MYILKLIPSQSTYFNIGAWGEKSLVPSKQQQENNPNQKTKPKHNQKMGWEHSKTTYPKKEE